MEDEEEEEEEEEKEEEAADEFRSPGTRHRRGREHAADHNLAKAMCDCQMRMGSEIEVLASRP
jgi:hypothetical protein